MGYTVKVEHPHFPQGTVFNVGGLDRVENGSSLEVDDDMERGFLMERGMSLEDAFKDDPIINVSGSSGLDANERQQLMESSPLYSAPEQPGDEQQEPSFIKQTPTVPVADNAEGGGENA